MRLKGGKNPENLGTDSGAGSKEYFYTFPAWWKCLAEYFEGKH